ncbi:MAG: electron transfer flavoprotein subunit alpha/FixB family protein [Bacteroidota bacterium]|nr:electron transfer flavoprotein subunit alpha/FixB family protein [Bacteroidota bacterium]
MSVLVYTENWKGTFRKSTFEAVSYARKTAKLLETDVVALSIGDVSDDELGKLANYGASKILSARGIEKGDSQVAANLFAEHAADTTLIVFASTYTSKMIAPRLAAKLKMGMVSNVVALPSSITPITVSRKAFSGKAIEKVVIHSEQGIISLAPNAFGLVECGGDCNIDEISPSEKGSVTIEGEEIASGKISLTEAEVIVSAGRGLKGPENWGMVEELAELLGAATACSKPVADIGWRPHGEHVGQTGKAVAPNLYVAIGISGAIQHLAGVNSSKVMVAINTDAEAPFFKAADYGIVGDAFEVVPRLIEEIKKVKN